MSDIDPQIVAEEQALWHELWSTAAGFTPTQLTEPGYFPEGWTAKDALAHVGTWLAEGGRALEQINAGTFVKLRSDELDSLNAQFLDAMRDAPYEDVKTQAIAARSRLLGAWVHLGGDPDLAQSWIRKSGPEHYAEHLPRLELWLAELRGREKT